MVLNGDVLEMLKTLPDESVQCCVTSPPYWGLRDYGMPGQIGLEKTPEKYVAKMVEVFREVRRVLRSNGVLWLNLGDSYMGGGGGNYNKTGISQAGGQHLTNVRNRRDFIEASGVKPKDLVGIPWRVAFALQADGWWLRQDIIWSKPNPMPESVTDRCTKSHEYIFLLTKSARYYYDADAVRQPHTREWQKEGWTQEGRRDDLKPVSSLKSNHGGDKTLAECYNPAGANRKSVWSIPNTGNREREIYSIIESDMQTSDKWDAIKSMMGGSQSDVWRIITKPFSGAHFATFPPEIPEICIKAGSKEGDTILDPFAGSGTTLEVAERMGRKSIGIELNPKYVTELIEPRLANVSPLFMETL